MMVAGFPASNNSVDVVQEDALLEDSETASSSNASSENRLLGSSKNSSQIIDTGDKDTSCYSFGKGGVQRPENLGYHIRWLIAVTLLLFGTLTLIWTPFQIFMSERLRMTPGFPPYEWWKNPPDKVLLRVYVFNITNSQKFLEGIDAKLKIQEVGPLIFLEKLTHSNVSFNDNDTLSYVAKRQAIFLPESNTIDLDAPLVVPNLAVLGMASYLWDATFFTKFAFNVLLSNLESSPIVNSTIRDYLWNFSDPILDVAQSMVPSLVPVKNMGLLSRIYDEFEDSVTVYIGAAHGHENFFSIDKYDGSEFLPWYGDACEDKVANSTEGVAYRQFLTKKSVVRYWRKTLCKVTPLYYDRTVKRYGVEAYRFYLPNNTFDRTFPSYADCHKGEPELPNGLSDVSKCYYNFPMASSFPHFLHGDEILKTYVDGLTPKESEHDSFVIIEPTTGIPIESRARSQSNLIVKKLSGFNEIIDKFGDTVIPMFWAEYNQVGLPWYIYCLIYFTVKVLPPLQKIITVVMLAVGLILITSCLYRLNQRSKHTAYLLKNKRLAFGSAFLRHK